MTKEQKIREVIAGEEFMVRQLRSDIGKELMAAALYRAGVQGGITSKDGLPHLMAEGVIAFITEAIEAGTQVRRAALGETNESNNRSK